MHPTVHEYKRLSDEALLHRYVSRRDPLALHLLFDRYGHLVFGLCCRVVAEAPMAWQFTQQIFLEVAGLHVLPETEDFRSWLYRRAVQLCPSPEGSTPAPSAENVATEDRTPTGINEDALDFLGEKKARYLQSFYADGMTFQEIAASYGEQTADVGRMIFEAKQELKKMLETV